MVKTFASHEVSRFDSTAWYVDQLSYFITLSWLMFYEWNSTDGNRIETCRVDSIYYPKSAALSQWILLRWFYLSSNVKSTGAYRVLSHLYINSERYNPVDRTAEWSPPNNSEPPPPPPLTPALIYLSIQFKTSLFYKCLKLCQASLLIGEKNSISRIPFSLSSLDK